jgi:hypothetical protein
MTPDPKLIAQRLAEYKADIAEHVGKAPNLPALRGENHIAVAEQIADLVGRRILDAQSKGFDPTIADVRRFTAEELQWLEAAVAEARGERWVN